MSQYIVSARKYRPNSFESLVGQDNIVQTLKNSIIRNKLAHAYLFCGPRGVGKTSAARIFAKTINCANPTAAMEPCGECESCKSFKEGRSYCIHEMDAASNNSVEDIKSLIEQVHIPPQVGHYSVYIVDEVHMLSTAAFNAFLKTLEEPPSHAIFILATTEKHKIPATILSRCQTFDFNRISIPVAMANLRKIADNEGVKIDDETLHIIAMKADGAMRDALTIFDQTLAFCGVDVKYEEVLKNLNVLDYEYTFSLVSNFLMGDYTSALQTFDKVLSKGFNALYFVSALNGHLRNLIVCKGGGVDSLLDLPKSLKDRYLVQAGKCTLNFLFESLNITSSCEATYRASVNPRLHIEFMLMKLCFLNGALKNEATHSGAEQNVPIGGTTAKEDKEDKEEIKQEPSIRQGRKRSTITPIIGVNSIKEKTNTTNTIVPKEPHTDVAPSEEVLKEAWGQMAKEFASRPRLATAIGEAQLQFAKVEDYQEITFFVANEAQRKWIEEKLLKDLEKHLFKKTNSTKLKLRVDVLELEDIERKSLTQKEKAQLLMSTNPEVLNLVKDMNLDV